jgi:hypothetical protein
MSDLLSLRPLHITKPLAGIMNEKQPDKLKMNTIEFLLRNMRGWLRKKTQTQFMSAGEIISIKCPCDIEVRTDS